MGSNPNTLTIQAIWSRIYEITHYTMPIYRAFATERGENQLKLGDTWHRDYISDFLVNGMGGDGSYSTQAITDTDEYLTVNVKKEVSFQMPKWITIQMHLDTIQKAGEKAAHRIWDQVDATLISAMTQAAATVVDSATIGAGSAGVPIVVSTGNIASIYSACNTALLLANVKYQPNKKFTGMPGLDKGELMTCAAISPQVQGIVDLYVAGKNSAKGDEVTTNGYLGYFLGFNNFVSNNLLWEGDLYLNTNPGDNDYITLLYGISIGGTDQSLTFTFKSTLGSTAGNVKICSTAAKTVTNLKNVLNAPYTTIAETSDTGYAPFVKASLTTLQNLLLANISCNQITISGSTKAASSSGTYAQILVAGFATVPVTKSLATGTNVWTYQIQHNLFGTSQSVDLIMQKKPNIETNPVSGKIATDYIIWNLYGYKVFNDQKPQLIDVQIDASVFSNYPTKLWA